MVTKPGYIKLSRVQVVKNFDRPCFRGMKPKICYSLCSFVAGPEKKNASTNRYSMHTASGTRLLKFEVPLVYTHMMRAAVVQVIRGMLLATVVLTVSNGLQQ